MFADQPTLREGVRRDALRFDGKREHRVVRGILEDEWSTQHGQPDPRRTHPLHPGLDV